MTTPVPSRSGPRLALLRAFGHRARRTLTIDWKKRSASGTSALAAAFGSDAAGVAA